MFFVVRSRSQLRIGRRRRLSRTNRLRFAIHGGQRWKIDQVLKERKMLVDELTLSYRMLSALIREHADDAHINPSDLNILGRKIYAALERKAGKVELVNPGISEDLSEPHLTFQQNCDDKGLHTWSLYLTLPGTARLADTPVKRASSLLELLAWCHFNHIVTRRTMFTVQTESSHLTEKELRATIEAFSRNFPKGKLPKSDLDDLAKPAQVRAAALFVNIGFDPLATTHLMGSHLTTGRTDALSFGATWENLALHFDQITVNSWQEVHTYRASGNTAVLRSLCKYFENSPISANEPPASISVYSLSSARGNSIARRIEHLYHDVSECYFSPGSVTNSRYILRIKDRFYILSAKNDRLTFESAGLVDDLLRALSATQSEFSPIIVDRYTLKESPLPLLFKANKRNAVQFFYQVHDGTAEIYVLDERGSLFHQELPFHDSATLLTQYQWFFDTVLPRLSFMISEQTGEAGFQGDVSLYQIVKNTNTGEFRLEPRKVPHSAGVHRYFNVQVIGDLMDDRPVFTIYCDDREFSSLEHGDALFQEVARDIFDRRSSGEGYPIYITDIDISKAMISDSGVDSLQTIHYLNHKKRIEERLNQALNAL
nr:class I adenylate cyclase [Candidatus Reidiella endopervernicosa]